MLLDGIAVSQYRAWRALFVDLLGGIHLERFGQLAATVA